MDQSSGPFPKGCLMWVLHAGWGEKEVTNVEELLSLNFSMLLSQKLGESGLQPWLLILLPRCEMCRPWSTSSVPAVTNFLIRFCLWASDLAHSLLTCKSSFWSWAKFLRAYVAFLFCSLTAMQQLLGYAAVVVSTWKVLFFSWNAHWLGFVDLLAESEMDIRLTEKCDIAGVNCISSC